MSFQFSKLWRIVPVFAWLAGCAAPTSAPTSAPTQTAFPADDLGRPVALTAPAERVVVIGPGAVETVYALNAEKQLVGRDDYAAVPPAAKSIAIAGNYQGPNIEQSIALRPDLVIVQGETYDATRAQDWQLKIGAPVAVLRPNDLAKVRDDIEKLGVWLGKTGAAKKLAATLIFPAPAKNGPTAFIETSDAPLYAAGQGTLVGNVLEVAGFRNATKVKGYQPYNVENLLADAPDFLIVPSSQTKAQVLAKLRRSPAFSKLDCVRKGRVIAIDGDLLLRPGPRLQQGIAILKRERLAQAP